MTERLELCFSARTTWASIMREGYDWLQLLLQQQQLLLLMPYAHCRRCNTNLNVSRCMVIRWSQSDAHQQINNRGNDSYPWGVIVALILMRPSSGSLSEE
mmetsp:Transcript_57109/g.170213  ORF Transcript_57109/g.170213 Transcript_57109/m.170213 type:complete len:100 (+) Transcript_57109:999-1298(+)